jgi:hypothetical protein
VCEIVNGLMSILQHRPPIAGHPQKPAAALDALRLLRSLGLEGTLKPIHDALYAKFLEEGDERGAIG